jgi:hypothetical protein
MVEGVVEGRLRSLLNRDLREGKGRRRDTWNLTRPERLLGLLRYVEPLHLLRSLMIVQSLRYVALALMSLFFLAHILLVLNIGEEVILIVIVVTILVSLIFLLLIVLLLLILGPSRIL